MTLDAPHVAVIGAGINGTATALWLLRLGARVTLIDQAPPGQGASLGNAGVLAASGFVPVTTPGLWARALPMLLDRDSPLFLRWSYLPRIAPWLLRYMSHATDNRARRIAAALAPLVTDSPDEHLALTEGLEARRYVHPGAYVYAYRDRRAYEADRYAWAMKQAHGVAPELVTGAAVREVEPALGPGIGCLAILRGHGHIADPGGYVAALARDVARLGGTVMQARVTGLALERGRVAQVLTERGPVPCMRAVIAAGAHAGPLLAQLGLRVPLETERGYHLHFRGATGGPARPTMIASGAFVATPMADGVRCAGVLELGGLKAGPSRAPLDMLRRQASQAFPALVCETVTEWMGHRPALPDSLPLIGGIGQTGVIAALGHHHVGLTAGPKTGRLAAQIALGQSPNLDLAPYAPARFA